MLRWGGFFTVMMCVVLEWGIARAEVSSDAFPLGKIPAGWTYKKVSPLHRQLEGFPFEVAGVLKRQMNSDETLSIFVVMKPVERVGFKPRFNYWSWIDQTFVRQVASAPKTFELDVQQKVGPMKKWEFREAKVYRAGIASNLAGFHTQGKYHRVFLVLRDDALNYQAKLTQLKDLVADIQVD